jgi:hypothetical protein
LVPGSVLKEILMPVAVVCGKIDLFHITVRGPGGAGLPADSLRKQHFVKEMSHHVAIGNDYV